MSLSKRQVLERVDDVMSQLGECETVVIRGDLNVVLENMHLGMKRYRAGMGMEQEILKV